MWLRRIFSRQLIVWHPLLDFTQNYFALFGLVPDFNVDEANLVARYRDIQSAIHPDRFAGKTSQDQRLAVQSAAFVNEAYQCLKNPLLRAQYLLRLKGREIHTESTHHDMAFLLEQMQLRESLEDIMQQKSPSQAFGVWRADVTRRIQVLHDAFGKLFAAEDYEHAVDSVLKWQFLVKLQADADKLWDQLDQDN